MAVESAIKIHVAVDECDFRIYCGVHVLEIQNRKSRENTKEKYRQEKQSWIQTLVQKILLFYYLFSIFYVL